MKEKGFVKTLYMIGFAIFFGIVLFFVAPERAHAATVPAPTLKVESYSTDRIVFSFDEYKNAKSYTLYLYYKDEYQKMGTIKLSSSKVTSIVEPGFICKLSTERKNGRLICTFSNLKCGSKYKLRAVCNTKSKSSKKSKALTKTTGLGAVSNVTLTVDTSAAIISWDELAGAYKYGVYRKDSTTGFKRIGSAYPGDPKYTDVEAVSLSAVEYKIKGFCKNYDGTIGGGKVSKVVSIASSEATPEPDDKVEDEKKEEEKKEDEKKEDEKKEEEKTEKTEPVDTGKIKLSTTTLFLKIGSSSTLQAETELTDEAKWTSSNSKVATVDSNGKVTAVAGGNCEVTITKGNECTKALVIVKDAKMIGVDVSKWQDKITWSKVAQSGIEFAIIRAGHSAANYLKNPRTFAPEIDLTFEKNYTEGRAAGIKMGCYYYTMALTEEQIEQEANAVLKLLDGRPLDLPIVLDLESRSQAVLLTKNEKHAFINKFKQIVEAAGYKFMLYGDKDYFKEYLDVNKLNEDGIDVWLAQYYAGDAWMDSKKTNYTGNANYKIWQYSSEGRVDGISYKLNGKYTAVDLDLSYVKF